MKSIYIFILLTVSLTVYSQPQNTIEFEKTDEKDNQDLFNPTLMKSTLSQTSFISDSSITTIWDGSQWVNSQKREFNYDKRGNKTLDVISNWDEGKWVFSTKNEWEYDSNNNYIFRIYYNWDINYNRWVNNQKRDVGYDSNNNRTSIVDEIWDENLNTWMSNFNVFWEYDVSNNETKEENYFWDLMTNQLIESRKFERSYNENGDMLELLDSHLDINTNQWVYDYKGGYTYDINWKLTERRNFSWDTSTNQWNNTNLWTYHYDDLGNLIYTNYHEVWNTEIDPYDKYKLSEYSYDVDYRLVEIVTYNYIKSLDSKGFSSKNEYGYDEYGNTILFSNYYWSSNQWVGDQKYEHSFDMNGNQTLYSMYQGWDLNTNSWIGRLKIETTFDENSNPILSIRYEWENNQWGNFTKNEYEIDGNGNNIRTHIYTWDGTQWIKTSIITYYFTLIPPSDILISNSTVDEDSETGTEIGILSSVDVDNNGTFIYSLVSGEGDTDNSSFTIMDNKLLSGEVFDFETKSSYSIRIQTDDGNGGTFSKSFTISVNSTLGINEYFNENVKIYPNPITDNSFTIETPFNQTIQLHLLDIHGRTIIDKVLHQNINKITLDDIPDGLYFIQLIDGNQIIHKQKIIKRK